MMEREGAIAGLVAGLVAGLLAVEDIYICLHFKTCICMSDIDISQDLRWKVPTAKNATKFN